MSVIHPAGTLPVAPFTRAVTAVSVMAVGMVATLIDPREGEVSRQGSRWFKG